MSFKKVLALTAAFTAAAILLITAAGCSGDNGVDGRDGIDGKDGADGADGRSCDVEEDGAYFVIKCGDAEKARWAKAMCGAAAYDPNEWGCRRGKLAFTDPRDNKVYRVTTIGGRTWMAENLNYRNTAGSGDTVGVCYDNSADSCSKYGRLYAWVEVMVIDSEYKTTEWGGSDAGHKGICPDGWHVPSDTEWWALMEAVGGVDAAGTNLKSTSGWASNGNGTDEYGFSALPGGSRSADGSFSVPNASANWWTASEFDPTASVDAQFWSMRANIGFADYGGMSKLHAYSVRCVMD